MGSNLQRKRVLIIGSGGQDGRILSELLYKLDNEIYGAISPTSEYKKNSHLKKVFIGDLANYEFFKGVVTEIQPTSIFHFGAVHADSNSMSNLEFRKADLMYRCHVGITKNILEWQKKNQSCTSLIALSSFIFTPTHSNQQISFQTPFNPQGVYGQTKLDSLRMLREYREKYGIRTAGLILFNHTSIYSKQGFLVPKIGFNLALSAKSKKIQIIKNSEQLVDISDAREFCKGFIQILSNNCFQDLIFSSGKLISVRSLYEAAGKKLHLDLGTSFRFDGAGGELPSMYGQINMTRKSLGWVGGGDVISIIEEWFQNGIKKITLA